MDTPEDFTWDQQVDLLVFGSGIAGLTAALVGRCEGLDVLLCEKTDQLGGTAATSGGTIWVPGSTAARRNGPVDLDEVRTYLNSEIGDRPEDAEHRDAFIASGAEALDYLEARTDVKFSLNKLYPDYHAEADGGALGGRALSPVPFDADVLGDDFALVRPPMREFMVLGGMMVARADIPHLTRPWSSWLSFKTATAMVWRYLRDRLRFARGTRLHLGNALVARYFHSLRKAGAGIALNARLVKLVRDGTRVAGAIVEIDGKTRRIGARRGVVLATGGFGASREARDELLNRGDIPESLVFQGNVGEGLATARAAGAVLDEDHPNPAFWMPASILQRPDGTRATYPHIRDRPKPGLIAVDGAGRRFVNEANSYHDFVSAMFAAKLRKAWLICDRAFVRDYGIGMIPPIWQRLGPYIKSGYLLTGDSIAALARQIGADPATLEQTVADHNGYCKTGVDLAFGKGSLALNRYNGDAEVHPNPCLKPIAEGPFFAVAVYPAPIGTSMGLRTDADARVLGQAGAPITGLYAGGSDMSSLMRGTYPGPGITLGPSIVFGYRAVRHMCRSNLATGSAEAEAPV